MQGLGTAGLDVSAKPHQAQLTSKCQEALDSNTPLICRERNRQLLRGEGKNNVFFFFFALKTRNQPTKQTKKTKYFSFRRIHYFLPLKRPLSDFHLSHMPVANGSFSFPFYKAAQAQALSDSRRLTIFLFKWLMQNQSQKWRSGKWFLERRDLRHKQGWLAGGTCRVGVPGGEPRAPPRSTEEGPHPGSIVPTSVCSDLGSRFPLSLSPINNNW